VDTDEFPVEIQDRTELQEDLPVAQILFREATKGEIMFREGTKCQGTTSVVPQVAEKKSGL
jgi:hypothetical protein